MKFDIFNKIISITARRGSGKTKLVKHLLKLYRHMFDKVFLICPSEFNQDYTKEELIPENQIFYEYDEDWVLNLTKKMEQVNKGGVRKHILLVLDDCLSDITMRSSKIKSLRLLASRGRHMGISVIVTAQALKMLSPLFRQNSDYLFLGKLVRSDIENVADEFRVGLSKKEFIKLIEDNAGIDYKFVVINNCGTNSDDLYGIVKVDI